MCERSTSICWAIDSFSAVMESHSPTAMEKAPATMPAMPVSRTRESDSLPVKQGATTPRMRQRLLTSPSRHPRTAARVAPCSTFACGLSQDSFPRPWAIPGASSARRGVVAGNPSPAYARASLSLALLWWRTSWAAAILRRLDAIVWAAVGGGGRKRYECHKRLPSPLSPPPRFLFGCEICRFFGVRSKRGNNRNEKGKKKQFRGSWDRFLLL